VAAAVTPSRREALLVAAASLFRERGYAAVGMQDLGAAAGIVGSGVYRHFESKLAILAELTNGVLDGLVEGARRIRSVHGADAAAALRALVDFHLDFALDQSDIIAVYLGEERNLSEVDRRRGRRKQRTYLGEWTDVLAVLRPDLPDDEVPLVVEAAISLLHSVVWQRQRLPRDVVEARLRAMALAALLTPVSPA
jgi:AcrR family transcriptional regulator